MRIAILILCALTLSFNAISQDRTFKDYYQKIVYSANEQRIKNIDALFSAIGSGQVEEDPFSMAYVYLMKGRTLSTLKRKEEALKAADDLAANASKYGNWTELRSVQGTAEAYAHIIRAYASWWADGNIDDAKAKLKTAEETYPNFYSHFIRGEMAYNAAQFADAVEHFNKAANDNIALTVDRADMYYYMGLSYADQKLSTKAIDAYTKAMEQDPQCKHFFQRGAEAFYSSTTTDLSQAYEDINTLLSNCPPQALNDKQNATAHMIMAHGYEGARNYSQAANYYAKAYGFLPDHYYAAYAASSYLAIQQNSQAHSWATKSINAASGVADVDRKALSEAYFVRGYVNLTNGDKTSAKSDLINAKNYGHAQAAQFLSQYF